MVEEQPLVSGRWRGQNKRNLTKIASCTLLLLCLLFLFGRLAESSSILHHHNHQGKKNVIFFVTDGMGPASLSLARSFRQLRDGLPINDTLVLDQHLIGSSRTRSSDSLVTDSAAGATAFACALKTYNGAIGVNSNKLPCGTVLEAAKLDGFLTGLVVTTRITDATPASFSAHVDYRSQEDQIALQQLGRYPLGRMVDLMIGGGRTHFYPASDHRYGTKGSRADNRNLIDEAIHQGWSYVGSRQEFDTLQLGHNVSLPLLGLLADFDIPFDLDRSPKEYPSLEEQTITALTALSEACKDSDKGFFLMVEGSRIDHAGHQNDPAAQAREVLAFDKALKAAIEFTNSTDVETILISTSDHETGGLVTARQVTEKYPDYLWYPQVLLNSTHSGEYLNKKINDLNKTTDKEKLKSYIKDEILTKYMGIKDYSSDDINTLLNSIGSDKFQYKLNDMLSTRAQIGWTTHGHSAVDVNIYAFANKKEAWYDILDNLQGNHENTDIGAYMSKYLNLDLSHVTDLIRDTKHSPSKDVLEAAAKHDIVDQYYHLIGSVN